MYVFTSSYVKKRSSIILVLLPSEQFPSATASRFKPPKSHKQADEKRTLPHELCHLPRLLFQVWLGDVNPYLSFPTSLHGIQLNTRLKKMPLGVQVLSPQGETQDQLLTHILGGSCMQCSLVKPTLEPGTLNHSPQPFQTNSRHTNSCLEGRLLYLGCLQNKASLRRFCTRKGYWRI